MHLQPHLNFGGDCEQAFHYYAEHLGGRITTLLRVRDLPAGSPRPPGSPEAVIHARLSLAGFELIGNDVPPEVFQPIRSAYLSLTLDSPEEVERVYAALMDGGTAGIPLGETFFATRFAQLRDRFGALWSIMHPRPAA